MADTRVVVHDDPLEGPVEHTLVHCLARMQTLRVGLLRAPDLSEKPDALASIAGVRFFDPSLAGKSTEVPPIGFRGTVDPDSQLLILNGLERANARSLTSFAWVDEWQQANGLPVLVVLHSDLPRPDDLRVDLDALVIGESRAVELSRMMSLAGRVSEALPSEVADYLASMALSMEAHGGGCAVEAQHVRDEFSHTPAALDSIGAAARDAGFLSDAQIGADSWLVFPETWMKVVFLARALESALLSGSVPSEASFGFHAYFAECQALAPAARAWVWYRAAAVAIGRSGALRDRFVAILAERNPLLAGMALGMVGAAPGIENAASAVTRAVSGTGERDLPERATKAMVLSDLRRLSGASPVLFEGGEGVSESPVSNADFEAFVRDSGYSVQRWWTDPGWHWRRNSGLPESVMAHWRGYVAYLQSVGLERLRVERHWRPERYRLLAHLCSLSSDKLLLQVQQMLLRSVEHPAYFKDVRLNGGSKPVVGVTMFEAEAYCSWLSEQLGRAVRLPSATEWESAFSDSSAFPWGDDYAADRANTIEAGLGSTTPIGAFGLFNGRYDMCGNVWEWTSTEWSVEDDGPLLGKTFDRVKYQVVKGGSWDNLASYGARDIIDVDPLELFGTRLGFRLFFE